MKKIEVKPTSDNILSLMEKNIIGRNEDIRNFLELLDNVDDNFTIFINADWGAGKTFFVKQLKLLLTYLNENIKEEVEKDEDKLKAILETDIFKGLELNKNFVPIYYNAWNNDSHADPISSIIFSIIKEHNILKDYQNETGNLLNKIFSVLDITNIWSNGSLKDLVETFKGKDIIPEITTMQNVKETLNLLLDELLVEKGDKLVVFIDEIDRCNPTYAMKILERVKHFFDHENVIFIFSVNNNELIKTISNFYGNDFDSYRYLSKFFDISIDLPNISISNYMCELGFQKDMSWFSKVIFELIEYYNFTMRDCIRYIQSINIVKNEINANRGGFSEDKGFNLVNFFIIPLLLCLKIINLKLYMEIIKGNDYRSFIKMINEVNALKNGISHHLSKDENGEISEESYNEQMQGIYNALFKNKEEKEYNNKVIELDRYTYSHLRNVLSLLRKGFKYN